MRAMLLITLLAGTSVVLGQCSVSDQTICTGTVDAATIIVNGMEFHTESNACYFVGAGDSLSLDAINCLIMVESGGGVNANGVNHLVLAKAGAHVGFCGSGYANRVNHEQDLASLDCLGAGNTAMICEQVTFNFVTGLASAAQASGSLLQVNGRSLVAGAGLPAGSALQVMDATGRVVLQRVMSAGERMDRGTLPDGCYLVHGGGGVQPLRFVLQ